MRRTRMMLQAACAVLAIAGSVHALAAVIPPAGHEPSDVAPIEIRTRLDDDMFPESWRAAEIDARAVQLKPQEAERGRRLVRRAMSKYPNSLLGENLDRVYLVDRLAYSGITAAGTNSLDRVYLVVRDPSEGYTDDFVESSFHHEFSSILLRNHRELLDDEAWNDCHPDDFQYGDDGVAAVKNGEASTSPRRRYMKHGFMSQYALSSMENDFNLIAEELFMGRDEFRGYVDEFPVLRRKVELTMSFYQKLDGSLTPERFRRFGRDASPDRQVDSAVDGGSAGSAAESEGPRGDGGAPG